MFHRLSKERHGLSLAELMIACAIMSLMAGAVGMLALSTQSAHRAMVGSGDATQHARVVIDRIERTLLAAKATADFPGFFVLTETVGTYNFPDTLVVWRPTTTAVNANGPPLFSELVIFRPNPANPRQLLEITAPNDTRATPAVTNAATWKNEIDTLTQATTSTRVVLTDLLRVCQLTTSSSSTSVSITAPGSSTSSTQSRGAVRFIGVQRPTATEYTNYKSGLVAFDDLAWAQSIFGATTGLRQSWCRFELQLMPGTDAFTNDPAGATSLPFFGSAALY